MKKRWSWPVFQAVITDPKLRIHQEASAPTKETISKVKRQPSEWEKIIANEATGKQLISKIYKQLLQLNSRKINKRNPVWKRHKTLTVCRWHDPLHRKS